MQNSSVQTPQWALERIKQAKQQKSNELHLSYPYAGEKLANFPGEIFELPGLTTLALRNNELNTLPESISQLQNLTTLDLGNNKLSTLPESISRLQNLTTLGLSANELSTLPEWISQLQNLTILDLSNNELSTLLESITQLQSLTRLELSFNNLSTLPEWISQLQSLTTLVLSANGISTLPESITRLQNLTRLELSANGLRTLPEEITQLQSLTRLELSGNGLRTLPEAITQLQNLTRLELSFNKLSTLPEAITQLHNLTTLDLRGNELSMLPESITQLHNLTTLRLSNNQLSTLPEAITQLENLTMLDVGENSLISPPPEIAEQGMEAIREYFRQLDQQGVDYLFEAKLLVLGEGGAGKTTFARKILDPNYVLREETSTQGVDVLKWSFRLEGVEGDRQFKVNIWDFGGQEIYHATHQFFLTRRSLYTLIADTRKDDTDFYYWLNIAELLSDNSPLLIVKNEKQDRHREINERQLQGQFNNLKEVLATNLATNRDLEKVKEAIKYHIRTLPHIGTPLPRTWVRVREQLEKDPHNTMSLEEYLSLCKANGFTETKDSLQLSGYLHDIGVFLHFQDEPLLRKTIMLKPKWGTDAVYKVLDNHTVIANLGHFTGADLETIWDAPEYETMRDELLQLMMKFKLCYEIPTQKGTYIAPQLLTENQPHYDWDEKDNLLLRYSYEFMPKGILTQFIVVMHPYIWGQNNVWRSGVVIEKDRTRAEVIEYYGKREIQVRVAGAHRRELLTIVMHELDEIHSNFRGLKYDKLIPCSCAECKNSPEPFFHKFETLQNLLEKRKTEVQCGRSGDMVNARGLIDDIVGWKTEKEVEDLMAKKRQATQAGFNVGDNFSGTIIYNSTVSNSFNKIDNSGASDELKETLKQLTVAVEEMKKEMPEEKAEEVADDMTKLTDEAIKEKPTPKWYSVSIDGLIAAAQNLGKVGDEVIKLAGKVRTILTGGLL